MATTNPTEDFARQLALQSKVIIESIHDLNKILQKNEYHLIDLSDFEKRLERQQQTARKPFTICFYGSFNSGKSTIINALLRLTQSARLSSENSPDTAKSIRLQHRPSENQAEVVIHFKKGQSKEMTWLECKKFTSQVHLKKTPGDEMLADNIEEVNYFVPENGDTSLISLCNIIDLPGTGSAEGLLHDEIANERIRESELIFWVIPTHKPEVDVNELRNIDSMRSINAQVIPIINVWQDLENKIKIKIDPNDVKTDIEDHFRRHFSLPPTIFELYAKEAERAIERNGEPEEYTGYHKFLHFLQVNFFNIENRDKQRTSRISRIANVISEEVKLLLEQCGKIQLSIDEALGQLKERNEAANLEYRATRKILIDFRTQVDPMTEVAADKIIDIFIESMERFVRRKTSGINLRLIRRNFYEEEENQKLISEFKHKYLELDERSAPIPAIMKVFLDQVTEEARIRWNRYLEFDHPQYDHSSIIKDRVGVFIENLANDLTNLNNNRNFDLLILGSILTGPIGATIGLVGLAIKKILGKSREQILDEALLDARIQIKRNRTAIANNLMDKALEIHYQIQKVYDDVRKKSEAEKTREELLLLGMKANVEKVEQKLNSFQQEMKGWINVSPVQI